MQAVLDMRQMVTRGQRLKTVLNMRYVIVEKDIHHLLDLIHVLVDALAKIEKRFSP